MTLGLTYNADHQRATLSASDTSFLPAGLAAASASYTTNTLNQYTAAAGATKHYDKRGNLITDGTWTYGYDTENRLIAASKPGTTVAYSYDALGRRLSKTVNGSKTFYASFGQREIAEYAGSVTSTSVPTRRFVYGPGLDEPVASLDASSTPTYQFADTQGSIIALANAAGQVTERYAYTAYGTAIVSGPGTAAFRYTGRRYDPETGLYYYRARAYSPSLGRFLQADPIGTQGGINLYAYVGNDPANLIDPWGTASLSTSTTGFIGGLGQSIGNSVSSYLSDSVSSLYHGVSDYAGLVANDPREALHQAADSAIGAAPPLASLSEGLYAAEEAGVATTTVGRYMSQAELDAMTTSGRVQESFNNGVTSVTVPPDPAIYRAAPATDIFTQFDVPTSSLNGVGSGTAKIYGPNSIFGPRLGITEMPPATNIVIPR